MKTKKIVAESMPLALKMVRKELGDNAIIVNTRSIKSGGVFGLFSKQKFEVTAYAIDKKEPSMEPKPSFEGREKLEIANLRRDSDRKLPEMAENNAPIMNKKPQKQYEYYSLREFDKPEEKTPLPISPKPVVNEENQQNQQLLDELKDMRKMMMTFMMDEKKGNGLPVGFTTWINVLKKQGVDEEVIEHIINSLLKKQESLGDLTDEQIKTELTAIIEDILMKRIPDTTLIPEQTRMINVIGPTGVGKTTSIAKLATEQVLKQKRRVAMITTDVYRIAAVEQLKTYAGILNVPIEVVHSADELDNAFNKLGHYDLIYMDTTGRNYKEAQYRESIDQYLNHPLESDNYLVLSLTTKFEDMEILLTEFLDSPVKKLILTKLDETSSYGSILNIAYKYPYQLAYITNGQSVPEDINPMDAPLFTSYLLGDGK